MNQLIFEGTDLTNTTIKVKNIDEAIEKLKALKITSTQTNLNTLQKFKGLAQHCSNNTNLDIDWYLQ